ncbi:MAG: AAA family ATPase, partial [Pseudomonadota bacterium]
FNTEETKDDYKNCAQTGQTLECAIPKELDEVLAEQLVEEFIKERFIARDLIAEYALHWDKGNPHFHVVVTRRALKDGDFIEVKDREICSRSAIIETRALWAEFANQYLERIGCTERIDHRSFKDRGLNILPTQHEGWGARRRINNAEPSRIAESNDAIRRENIRIFKDNPEELVKLVADQKTVFSKADLEAEISKRVGGDPVLHQVLSLKVAGVEIPNAIAAVANDDAVYEPGKSAADKKQFAEALKENADKLSDVLLTSAEALALGSDVKGREIYTSQTLKQREDKALSSIGALLGRSTKRVHPALIDQYILQQEQRLSQQQGQNVTLSEEQVQAVRFLAEGPDVRVLIGRTGTGKTSIMQPVVRAYQAAGYRVTGLSFQGKTAENMERDIGMQCHTIDFFRYRWNQYQQYRQALVSGKLRGKAEKKAISKLSNLSQYYWGEKDVIVIDEANMVDMDRWSDLLHEVATRGAKLLVIQDPNQIKAVGRGDVGRILIDQSDYAELTAIYRQRIEWQKQASQALNRHDIERGFQPYVDNGRVTLKDEIESAKWQVINSYIKDHQQDPKSSKLAMAYTNKDVADLNLGIRNQLKALGYLGRDFDIKGKTFSVGDRVVFTRNDNWGTYVRERFVLLRFFKRPNHGVKNGTLGTITGYNPLSGTITVVDDNRRILAFNPASYDKLDYGYAITINKSEGDTVDRSYLLLSPLMDANSLLVGMTRHRYDIFVAAAKEHFADMQALVSKLGKGAYKKMVTDYTITEANRPYYENIQHYCDIAQDCINTIGSARTCTDAEQLAGLWSGHEKLARLRQQAAAKIVNDWENHQVFAVQAGLRRDVLEVAAGLRQRILSELELEARAETLSYFASCAEKNQLWSEIKLTHPGSLAKDHALHEKYAALRSECYATAYKIASTPTLYKQFFKFEKLETEAATDTETKVEFKDCLGRKWDKLPVTWPTLQKHSEQYIESQKEDYYLKTLSGPDRAAYQLLQDYRSALKDAASSYHKLKELDKAAVTPTQSQRQVYADMLETTSAQRDLLAFKIVTEVIEPDRFLEHCYQDVLQLVENEDKLLRHAVAGEVREYLQSYTQAGDYQERLYYAAELNDIVFGTEVHKPSYALIKNLGYDPSAIRFEADIHKLILAGKLEDKDYSNVATNFERYQQARLASGRQWSLIKSQVHNEIKDLQTELLEDYNQHQAQTVSLQEIETQVSKKLKSANENQVMQQVTLAIAGGNQESDAYTRLMTLHTDLQGGAGYLTHAEAGAVQAWQQAKSLRQEHADRLLGNHEEQSLVELILDDQVARRIVVDAREHQIKTRVRQFIDTDCPETKVTLAKAILDWKDLEQSQGSKRTLAEIRSQGVRIDTLQACRVVAEAKAKGTAPEGAQLKNFIDKAAAFSSWKLEYSKIWGQIIKDVEVKTAPFDLEHNTLKQGVFASIKAWQAKDWDTKPLDALTQQLESRVKSTINALEFKEKISRGILKQWFVERSATGLSSQLQSKIQVAEENLNAGLLKSFTAKDIKIDQNMGELKSQLALMALNRKAQQEIKNKAVAKHDLQEDLDTARVNRNSLAASMMQHAFFNEAVHASEDFHLRRIIEFDRAHQIRQTLKQYQASENTIEITALKAKIQDFLDYDEQHGVNLTWQTMAQTKIFVDPEAKVAADKSHTPVSRATGVPKSSLHSYDLETIRSICQRDGEKLVSHLLGTGANKSASSAKELRFGNKGSFVFSLQGRQAGRWHDFETGEGGNLFALVARERSMPEFKDQLRYVAEFYGISSDRGVNPKHYAPSQTVAAATPVKPEKTGKPNSMDPETAAKIARVNKAYAISKPIAGTLAETYLKGQRKIETPLPDSLRFISSYGRDKLPALAAFASNAQGECTGMQLTYLDPNTGKKANLAIAKRSHGKISGATVELKRGGAQSPIFVAEGVETALSIAAETPQNSTVLAALGVSNFKNIEVKANQQIIICADNDSHKPPAPGKDKAPAELAVAKAVAHLQQQGAQVQVISPATAGQDFNDVLQLAGSAEVRKSVDQALQQMEQGKAEPQDKKLPPKAIVRSTSTRTQRKSPAELIAADLEKKLNMLNKYGEAYLKKSELEIFKRHMDRIAEDKQLYNQIKQINPEVVKNIDNIKNQDKSRSVAKGFSR